MELKEKFTATKKGADVFRAINNPVRQKIINYLLENKKVTVTQLYKQLRMEQSVASQHLRVLRNAGIVKPIKEGRFVYYDMMEKRLNEIADVGLKLSKV